MDPEILKYLAYAMIFLATFLFIMQFFTDQTEKDMRSKTGMIDVKEWGEDVSLLKWCYPFVALLLPVVERLPCDSYKRIIRRWIIMAGVDGTMTANEFLSLQVVLSFLFPGILLLTFSGVSTFFVGFSVGILVPLLMLLDLKKSRQQDILIEMPNVVDMLSLSVGAGIDFNSAIVRVCEQTDDTSKKPLIQEFNILQQNIRLGMTREDALTTMADRIDLQDIYSFVSVLIQADKLGASIASILKQQSDKLRRERFMKAEKLGAEASQKLMIPMVIFIFPLLFFVVMGPYILKFIYQ